MQEVPAQDIENLCIATLSQWGHVGGIAVNLNPSGQQTEAFAIPPKWQSDNSLQQPALPLADKSLPFRKWYTGQFVAAPTLAAVKSRCMLSMRVDMTRCSADASAACTSARDAASRCAAASSSALRQQTHQL